MAKTIIKPKLLIDNFMLKPNKTINIATIKISPIKKYIKLCESYSYVLEFAM